MGVRTLPILANVPAPIIPKSAPENPAPAWLGWHPVAVGVVIFMLVVTPLMIVVWNMHSRANQILKGNVRDQLMSAARVVAKAVDADAHSRLKTAGQDLSDDYLRQVRRMDEAKVALDPERRIKFAYTCILDGGRVRFVLDVTPDGDADQDGVNDRAKLLEVYERYSPTLLEVLSTGVAKVDEHPYTDKWGTFMSGFAPIFDSNGVQVGAVGVDMSTEEYESERASVRHLSSWSAFGILLLAALAGSWMGWYHRRLQNSVRELVRVSDAAATAERVKADFLGAMSHELRTPLNAVLGMSEMLSQTTLDNKQQEMVATVSKCGESLLATLSDILEYSQLDSRQAAHESEEASLKGLLQEVRRHHERDLETKGLSYSLSIADGCPGRITGQVAFLKRILSQLLENAVKFTDSGQVAISVNARAKAGGEGGTLHFEVKDTGIGIAPDHLRHLFEPLFQADGSTTRRHGGTGMGLALCKRLCEAMHGRLWVESEPGRGSTFYLEIPVERFAPEAASPLRSAVIWTDDSMTAMLASRVVEKTGATVSVVTSLAEIRQLSHADSATVCVVDGTLVSPGDLKAARDLLPSARLVFVHGEATHDSVEGADVTLASPLRPADLRKALGV